MWSAAERETVAADEPVLVKLCGTEIQVPPIWEWPHDGIPALLAEAYEDWAQLALPDAEYACWADADPTLDDCDRFCDEWEWVTGQSIDTIGRLWHVLERWPEQLESDLVAHCGGQDLRHLWQPRHGPSRLTWRRLGVLYDGLPGHSLTKTAQANELGDAKLAELAKQDRAGHAPWSHTDLLLADVVDAVNIVGWILRQAHSDPKKQKQIKPPEPVHRPGLVRSRRRGGRTLTPEARQLLAYMAANRGALPPGQYKDVPSLPGR